VSSKTLYGTTMFGGTSGQGTIFTVNTDGTGFAILHNFTYSSSGKPLGEPFAALILSGRTLYGRAQLGGSSGNGEIFAINTDGTGFTTLHSFKSGFPTNGEGIHPDGGLVLSGNTLYGAALYGGTWGSGTIFSISFSPRLSIALSETNAVLSWPTNYAGFD